VAENSQVGRNFVDRMAIYMAFETNEELPSLPWGPDTSGCLLNSGLKQSSINWTDIQLYIVILDFLS
jgi:hypothetical protein